MPVRTKDYGFRTSIQIPIDVEKLLQRSRTEHQKAHGFKPSRSAMIVIAVRHFMAKPVAAAALLLEDEFSNDVSREIILWQTGADKECTFLNPVWKRITGRTFQQDKGFGWTEAVHPEDLPRLTETYTTAFDERRPFATEYRLRCANGQYIWVRGHGTPHYRKKKFVGYVGSAFQIAGPGLMVLDSVIHGSAA